MHDVDREALPHQTLTHGLGQADLVLDHEYPHRTSCPGYPPACQAGHGDADRTGGHLGAGTATVTATGWGRM
ncbi:hypothetical protein Pflav_016960 [Phytohabitans flavus]|uniref:Uncharacterized protein n=1 Tax=Phytohabitans flavus TaxID=1076124 RepID=A0A6F8XN91_9ACTN|nr:hypothetical protein Pflav_016960 [Phytohabitans flavus]